MLEQLKFGEMTLTWLRGGVTHLDGGAMFGVVPKPLWSRKYPVNENNQIELRTDPILIEAEGKYILIEAGIGKGRFSEKQKRNYGVADESRIDHDLQELGLTTDDIEIVLMTHMHFDHASGLVKEEEGKLVPVFKNATIYTSEREWEEMRNPNIRSKNTYWEDNWKPIEHQVTTFKEQLEILDGIKLVHTGGHSDGHCIVVLESGGERLLHLADLMPTHAHNNVLWVLAFDDYPMTSIAAKEKWLREGVKERAWFLFYHDVQYRAIQWNETGEITGELKRIPYSYRNK